MLREKLQEILDAANEADDEVIAGLAQEAIDMLASRSDGGGTGNGPPPGGG